MVQSLGARAAGYWAVSEGRLVRQGFAACRDMDATVASEFLAATGELPRKRLDLSIVQAVVEGRTVIAEAQALGSSAGSGHWLRRFDAARSVAVPHKNEAGVVVGVLSVAVEKASDPVIVESSIRAFLREEARSWSGPDATESLNRLG